MNWEKKNIINNAEIPRKELASDCENPTNSFHAVNETWCVESASYYPDFRIFNKRLGSALKTNCCKNVAFRRIKKKNSMQLQNCLIIIYMHVNNIFVVHHKMLVLAYIVSVGWLFSIRYEHPIHFYTHNFYFSSSSLCTLNSRDA